MTLVKKIKFFPFYLLSLLPLWVLYRLSDLIFIWVYWVIGYRRKVVRGNLELAFPKKSKKEISGIEKKFYHHFCDLAVESIKILSVGRRSIRKRIKIFNSKIIEDHFRNGKNIIIYAGHFGNWEWFGTFPLLLQYKLNTFYQPLQNSYFDQLMKLIRSRFGLECIPSYQGYKKLVEMNTRNIKHITLMVGDQSPANDENVVWTDFFNRKTAFLRGVDRISKKLDLLVVFPHFTKPKRGYYEIRFVTLRPNKSSKTRKNLIQDFSNVLQKAITDTPEMWLWTHRRWKLTTRN
ncbi:MAG: lysophospholipid acyltransferase family protein [Flavobacteriaceae bacterium]